MVALLSGNYKVNPGAYLQHIWLVYYRKRSLAIHSDGQVVWVRPRRGYRNPSSGMIGATP